MTSTGYTYWDKKTYHISYDGINWKRLLFKEVNVMDPMLIEVCEKYLFSAYDDNCISKMKSDILYYFESKNLEMDKISFNIDIDDAQCLNLIGHNLYTALAFDGVEDPYSYVRAGFHKLLNNGKYAKYHNNVIPEV
jgi:hypothetical protein